PLKPVAMRMRQAEHHGLARRQPKLGACIVKSAFALQRVLNDNKGRIAALLAIPGIDFIDALFVAGANGHAVQRRSASGQVEPAHLVTMVDELTEHKITL